MSKINIFSCYFCAVMLTVLCIAGAMLASVLLVVHNQNEFMHVAGSYSAVRLQQSHIQRKIEDLSQEYRFDPVSVGQTVNAAALSDFSQKTIVVWLGWISGSTAGTAPAWDTAALSNAIQADAGFE